MMWKALVFVLAGLAASSPTFAQGQRKQPTTFGPSALESHAARMENDAANDLKTGQASTGSFVDLDIVYPHDKAEYEALGKYALMVFALFSDNQSELPLARADVGGVRLQCLDSISRKVPPKSATAKAFGRFRADTLCLVPVGTARKSGKVKIDFAKNHDNLEVYSTPFEEPPFVKADSNPRSTPRPDPAVLRQFIAREYPGFGFRVRP